MKKQGIWFGFRIRRKSCKNIYENVVKEKVMEKILFFNFYCITECKSFQPLTFLGWSWQYFFKRREITWYQIVRFMIAMSYFAQNFVAHLSTLC